ncbi:hypothetical protein C8J56DRAFT_917405 [Mycena floridula]|nr:hypothetical protein C8J56DRAFT_917405 [Mycena floridula]
MWKVAALTIPVVWACIDIDTRSFPEAFLDAQSPQNLCTILSRAKTCPLSITVYLGDSSSVEVQLLYQLMVFSSQWENISLDLMPRLYSQLGAVAGRLPLLSSLMLSHRCFSTLPESATACFKVAPSLRRLTLSGFDHNLPFEMPWNQITHFNDYRNYGPNILCMLPNLVSHSSHRCIDLEEAVTLPQLRFLRVKNKVDFRLLFVPKLEMLECKITHCGDDLAGMLNQSICSLKTLVVHMHPNVPRNLSPTFLDAISSVTSLSLRLHIDFTITHFQLKLHLGQPIYLPNLRLLGVKSATLETKSAMETLLEVVRSRWALGDELKQGVKPLREIRFLSITRMTEEMRINYSSFDSFREEGLLVTLGEPGAPFP